MAAWDRSLPAGHGNGHLGGSIGSDLQASAKLQVQGQARDCATSTSSPAKLQHFKQPVEAKVFCFH